jgi:ATP-dependent RNA helicase DeaD
MSTPEPSGDEPVVDATDPSSPFAPFGLDPRVLMAVARLGFEAPTRVQLAAMGPLREGRDVLVRARTGSGKTAAFGLPLLTRLAEGGRHVRALILAPTRELALQVAEALKSFATELPLRILTVYGGAPYGPQLDALRRGGVTVVVGTPGRVRDLVDRGALLLGQVEVLVLDEADEMLRMGFVEDVEHLTAATPPTRQVALFSATVPDPIRAIARQQMKNPVELEVEGGGPTTDHVTQQICIVPRPRRIEALVRWLACTEREGTLIFVRTRAGCAEVAEALFSRGFPAEALHGDLSQQAREQVLGHFRSRQCEVLVATDVAARGLDVDHVSHVVNLEPPLDTESYVHRVGRTARAGRAGVALTFGSPTDRERLRRLARRLNVQPEEIRVPTEADVTRVRQDRLFQALAAVTPKDRQDAEALLAHWGAPELAVAAVALLCADRRIPLALPIVEEPIPAAVRHVQGADQLFVGMGRRDGLRAEDVVGALANECGIAPNNLGKIRILDRKSFVALPGPVLDHLLSDRSSLPLRGRHVRLDRARG